MRKFISLFLALSIAFQAFYNVGVTAYWLANRAKIAATLCENRDKPEMHCDGKCYLKKKIAESPDSAPAEGKTSLPNFKKGIELAELLPVAPVLFSKISIAERPILVFGEKDFSDLLTEKGIFHPPACVPQAS